MVGVSDVFVEDFKAGFLVFFFLLFISIIGTAISLFLWCLICYCYSLKECSGSFEDTPSDIVICSREIRNFHGKTIEEQIDEEEIVIEMIPA